MPAPLRRTSLTVALTLGCAFTVLSGCTRTPPPDERIPVLETYAQIVLATYEDSIDAATALDRSIDALLADPSPDTLAAARADWRKARIPYGYSEAFRFYAGPIDAEEGPEGQINGWPLDENHIDAVAEGYNAAAGANIISNAAQFPAITPELLADQNEAGGEKNIASGWHAIEFLLWGQDLNQTPQSAGERPHTDFQPQSDAADDPARRRGQYLKAASTLLLDDLRSVAVQWQPDADNYRRAFITGDTYTSLKRMLTGIAALSEVELAGERMNVPLLSGDQEEEQSCFSDTTSDDLRANAAGIDHVYFGRYQRSDGTQITGPSLASLIQARDARIADEIDQRLTRTREALAAIDSPFDQEILQDNAAGRERVQAGIDALRAQALSIGRGAQAIEIFLSDMEGLGD